MSFLLMEVQLGICAQNLQLNHLRCAVLDHEMGQVSEENQKEAIDYILKVDFNRQKQCSDINTTTLYVPTA